MRVLTSLLLMAATLAAQPDPNKIKVLLIGLLVGLGAGIGIMILMEFLDNSFHTVKDVEHYLGAEVLASIADHKLAASGPEKAQSFP